jgi:hypothetical protein
MVLGVMLQRRGGDDSDKAADRMWQQPRSRIPGEHGVAMDGADRSLTASIAPLGCNELPIFPQNALVLLAGEDAGAVQLGAGLARKHLCWD